MGRAWCHNKAPFERWGLFFSPARLETNLTARDIRLRRVTLCYFNPLPSRFKRFRRLLTRNDYYINFAKWKSSLMSATLSSVDFTVKFENVSRHSSLRGGKSRNLRKKMERARFLSFPGSPHSSKRGEVNFPPSFPHFPRMILLHVTYPTIGGCAREKSLSSLSLL